MDGLLKNPGMDFFSILLGDMMGENNVNAQNNEASNQKDWWELPFDATASFSLLGFFLGGAYWAGNPDKKVDMTLDE
jgi:hypothetical protein